MQLEKALSLYRKKQFTSIKAFLLLILFTAAQLIQALHHHEQDASGYSNSRFEQVHSSAQFKTNKINCKLCEVLKQQAHHYTLPLPYTMVVKEEIALNFYFKYLRKHPVVYILSAANKGPPSLIA